MMKNTIFLALMLLASMSARSLTMAQTPLSEMPGEGLIGYWPFDQVDGEVSKNQSAEQWAFKPYKPQLVNGVYGKALWFGGSAWCKDSSNFYIKPYATIAGWVTGKGVILSRGPGDDKKWDNKGWVIHNTHGKFQVRVGAEGLLDSSGVVDTSRWVHFALVRRGKTLTWYINGKKDASHTLKEWPDTNGLFVKAGKASGSPFGSSPLVGAIDELRVYDRALKDDQIQMLASAIPDLKTFKMDRKSPIAINQMKRYKVPQEGLQFWLDASDPMSVNTDGSGVVTSWKDKKHNAALSSAKGKQPVYAREAINGLSVVRFSGGQYLETKMNKSTFDKRTILFVVARVHNDGAYNIVSTKLNNETWRRADGNTSIGTARKNAVGGIVKRHAMPMTGLRLFNAYTTKDGKTYVFSVDGQEFKGKAEYDGIDRIRLGAIASKDFKADAPQNFIGDIAEVLVYNKDFDDRQLVDVNRYLADKWQLDHLKEMSAPSFLENEAFVEMTPDKVSADKNQLAIQPDGSILVEKQAPGEDEYRIQFLTTMPNIKAIRVSAMPDGSFKGGGPGMAQNGRYAIAEAAISTAAPKSPDQQTAVKLETVTTTRHAKSIKPAFMIDGNTRSAWVPTDIKGSPSAFTLVAASSFGDRAGKLVTLSIKSRMPLGRFKVAMTAMSNAEKITTPETMVETATQPQVATKTVELFKVFYNVSGPDYKDKQGVEWKRGSPRSGQSDGYWGGNDRRSDNTHPLYGTGREDIRNLRIKVPGPGKYKVFMVFCENWVQYQDQRVCHVDLEGKRVLTNFDAMRFGKFKPVLKSFVTYSDDNHIWVNFHGVHRRKRAVLAGIGVQALAPVKPKTPAGGNGNMLVVKQPGAGSGAGSSGGTPDKILEIQRKQAEAKEKKLALLKQRREMMAGKAVERAGLYLKNGDALKAYTEFQEILVKYKGTDATVKADEYIRQIRSREDYKILLAGYQEQMAIKMMATANKYIKFKQAKAAKDTLKELVDSYPDTRTADKAYRMLEKM